MAEAIVTRINDAVSPKMPHAEPPKQGVPWYVTAAISMALGGGSGHFITAIGGATKEDVAKLTAETSKINKRIRRLEKAIQAAFPATKNAVSADDDE